MNRKDFDYLPSEQFDKNKINELFTLFSDMNIQNIINFSNEYNIPLGVSNYNGDNLIHVTLKDETEQKNEYNRLNVIKFLVNHNVNPNAPNRDNITPLHLACKRQYSMIINYLINIGVNPNYEDNFGNTPLHYCLNGRLEKYSSNYIIDLIPPKKKEPFDINKIVDNQMITNIINEYKLGDDGKYKMILNTIRNTTFYIDNLDAELEQIKDNDEFKRGYFENQVKNKINEMWSSFADVTKDDYDMFVINDNKSDDAIQTGGAVEINGFLEDQIGLRIKTIRDEIDRYSYSPQIDYDFINSDNVFQEKSKYDENLMKTINVGNFEEFKRNLSDKNDDIDSYIYNFTYNYPDTEINNIQKMIKNADLEIDTHQKNISLYRSEITRRTKKREKEAAMNSIIVQIINNPPATHIDYNNIMLIIGSRIDDYNIRNDLVTKIKSILSTPTPTQTNIDNFIQTLNNIYNNFMNSITALDKEITNYEGLKKVSRDMVSGVITNKNNAIEKINFIRRNYKKNDFIIKKNEVDSLNKDIISLFSQDDIDMFKFMDFYSKKKDKMKRYLESSHAFYTKLNTNMAQIGITGIDVTQEIGFFHDIIGIINNINNIFNDFIMKQGLENVNFINSGVSGDDIFSNYIKNNHFIGGGNIMVEISDRLYDHNRIIKLINDDTSDIFKKINDGDGIDEMYSIFTNFKSVYDYYMSEIFKKETNIVDNLGREVYIAKEEDLLMLSAYNNLFNNNKKDMISKKNIIESYKKVGITRQFYKFNISTERKLTEWLKLFLDIDNDNEIIELCNDIFYDNNPGDINELLRLIISQYNSMEIRPLKLTLVDTLYIVRTLYDYKMYGEKFKKYEKELIRSLYIFEIRYTDYKLEIDGYEKEYLLPSRRIYSLYYDHYKNNESELRYITSKFIESYYMGYEFLGCFPSFDEVSDMKNILSQRGGDGNIYKVSMMFNGNSGSGNITSFIRDTVKYNNPKSYVYLFENFNKIIIEKISEILNEINGNLENLTKHNDEEFVRIFASSYPKLATYYELQRNTNDILMEIIQNKGLSVTSNLFNLESFVNNLNDINAYNYLTSVFNNSELKYFSFYKIPYLKKDKIVIYREGDEEGENKEEEGFNYTKNLGNLDNYIEGIMNGEDHISEVFINKTITEARNKSIPPSIEDHLYTFYLLFFINLYDTKKDLDIGSFADIPSEINKVDLKFTILNRVLQKQISHEINRFINGIYQYFSSENRDIPDEYTVKLFGGAGEVSFVVDNINLDGFGENTIINYYNLADEVKDKKVFIVYPQDYHNNELLRLYHNLIIDNNSINEMMKSQLNITIRNKDNKSPIYNIIRNLNYKVIEKLKEKINFRAIEGDNPILYTFKNLRNTNGIMCSGDYKVSLSNFVFNQYNEIEMLIMNNDKFGKNVLKNLNTSFVVCNYLAQQYLVSNLLKSSKNYGFEQLNNLISEYGKEISDLTKNNYKMTRNNLKNSNDVIIKEIINNLNKKIKKNRDKISKLKDENNILARLDGMRDRIARNVSKINDLQRINNTIDSNKLELIRNKSGITKSFTSGSKIIETYSSAIINTTRGSYMGAWNDYLGDIPNDDINMFLIDIIKDMDILVNRKNITIADTDEILRKIETITPALSHLSILMENYFELPHYINMNKGLAYVRDVLHHLTKNYLCFGIEIALRKALYSYFMERYGENKIEDVLKMTNYVLTREFDDSDSKEDIIIMESKEDSVIERLYKDIPPRLVKSSVNIFDDKYDKENYVEETVREILHDLFKDIEKIPLERGDRIQSDDRIMKILKTDMTSYFDTIIPKTIYNWQVVIENVFRYYINYNRLLLTLKNLI